MSTRARTTLVVALILCAALFFFTGFVEMAGWATIHNPRVRTGPPPLASFFPWWLASVALGSFAGFLGAGSS